MVDKNINIAPVTYTYDALSRRTSMSDTRGATTTYEFEKADRLIATTIPAGKRIAMTFDGADRKTAIKWPNGLQTRFTHDAVPSPGGVSGTGRVVSVAYGLDTSGTGGSALSQLLGTFTYGYTNRGNIASTATSGASANRTRTFEYDALERLTTVAGQVGNPSAIIESYTFDGEGNRVTSHVSSSHLTGPANRLTEDDTHVYAYDGNGNMVQKTIKATGGYCM